MQITQFFFRFWWAILFVLFCYGFYIHGMESKRKSFNDLQNRAASMRQQLEIAQETQKDLQLQIESLSDPAWAEMLIMKRLGMVPSGQVKVYFEE